MPTYRFEFHAVAPAGSFPPDFVQKRQRGHPLVGDSPIRAEFDTSDEYVTAWHRWVQMSRAYEREEQLCGEEGRAYRRTRLELRYPDGIPFREVLEEAGLI